MDKHYSGSNSKEFWGIINLVDDDNLSLFDLGCKLQNLEEKVLRKIGKRCALINDLKISHNKKLKQKKRKEIFNIIPVTKKNRYDVSSYENDK